MNLGRNFVWLVAGILAVGSSVPVSAQEWAGSGRVTGTVTDPEGQPIKDAKVQFLMWPDREAGPPPMVTNKKGKFSFLGIKGGSWIVVVEADQYRPWESPLPVEVYSSGVSEAVEVVLEPMPAEELQAVRRYEASQHLEKGDELAEQGDLVGARAEYERALEQLGDEDDPVALAAIASTYLNEGETESAKAALRQSLAINPDHVASLKAMCAIEAAEGRVDEAEAMLARMPADEPIHPTTLINIGMTHYNQGEMEEAKPFLDRALAQEPKIPVAYYYRSLVELSLGDTVAARNDLERFVELAPDHPQAAEANEYLSHLREGSDER